MIRRFQMVLLMLFVGQFMACSPIQELPPVSSEPALPATAEALAALPVSIALDESFRLRVSQQGVLDSTGLTIQFQAVLAESRCPSQVNCAEAGNATVVLDIRLPDQEPSRYELTINPPGSQEIVYDAYQIRLQELEPYPENIDQLIPQEAYRATLIVTTSTTNSPPAATPDGPLITATETGDGPSSEAEILYHKGLTQVAAGLPDEAIVSFTEALALYPTYIEAYQIRGDAYRAVRRYDLARLDYQQVLALNPQPDVKATVTAVLEEIAQAQSVLPTATVTATPAPPTPQPVPATTIVLDAPFSLKLNQRGVLETDGLTLEFTELLEDSRCPRQVNCIVAGKARLIIEAWLADQEPVPFEMRTDEQVAYTYEGYEIQLLSLDPYPENATPEIALEDYVATLVVSK